LKKEHKHCTFPVSRVVAGRVARPALLTHQPCRGDTRAAIGPSPCAAMGACASAPRKGERAEERDNARAAPFFRGALAPVLAHLPSTSPHLSSRRPHPGRCASRGPNSDHAAQLHECVDMRERERERALCSRSAAYAFVPFLLSRPQPPPLLLTLTQALARMTTTTRPAMVGRSAKVR
jgi:hypothetical protein